ncbi:hypothetical protein BaRGS_00013558 [Batillaria attramentaria]|uniref:Uncharacterized protein n=1 Tax=Batillaria attramentaria TaxID=370345 RepID=A0ABD0L759_9CAEN
MRQQCVRQQCVRHQYIRHQYVRHQYVRHQYIRHQYVKHQYIRHQYVRHQYETAVCETPVCETPVCETALCETPVCETPVCETPVCETPVRETPVCKTAVCETPVCETLVCETPVKVACESHKEASGKCDTCTVYVCCSFIPREEFRLITLTPSRVYRFGEKRGAYRGITSFQAQSQSGRLKAEQECRLRCKTIESLQNVEHETVHGAYAAVLPGQTHNNADRRVATSQHPGTGHAPAAIKVFVTIALSTPVRIHDRHGQFGGGNDFSWTCSKRQFIVS